MRPQILRREPFPTLMQAYASIQGEIPRRIIMVKMKFEFVECPKRGHKKDKHWKLHGRTNSKNKRHGGRNR